MTVLSQTDLMGFGPVLYFVPPNNIISSDNIFNLPKTPRSTSRGAMLPQQRRWQRTYGGGVARMVLISFRWMVWVSEGEEA